MDKKLVLIEEAVLNAVLAHLDSVAHKVARPLIDGIIKSVQESNQKPENEIPIPRPSDETKPT